MWPDSRSTFLPPAIGGNMNYSKYHALGNGLRIFARFLWDTGHVRDAPFTVDTPGGTVTKVCEGVMADEMFEEAVLHA